MPPKVRQYVGWALVGLLLLWIIVNWEQARVNFFILKVDIPVALLIFFSAALGAGAVFALKYIKSLRREEPPK